MDARTNLENILRNKNGNRQGMQNAKLKMKDEESSSTYGFTRF
jgi:hypothetical protein